MPLLKDDAAILAHGLCCEPYRPRRIGFVHQKEPPNHGIEGSVFVNLLERFGAKVDPIEAFVRCAPPNIGNDSAVNVGGDNLAAVTESLGDEQGQVGESVAEHEDAHAGCDARAREQLLGQWLCKSSLNGVQALRSHLFYFPSNRVRLPRRYSHFVPETTFS
jgi:hypothetical protein